MDSAVSVALRRAAEVGPFFTLGVRPGGEGWYAQADLTSSDGQPLLSAVLTDYARRLGTPEPRVAASLFYQGYAALVWSPVLACLREGVLLDLDPTRFHLRCHPNQSLTAALTPARATGSLAVTPLLEAMAAAVRRIAPVPDRLLAGNAASALTGAARVLATHHANHPGARGTRGPAAGAATDRAEGGAAAGPDTADEGAYDLWAVVDGLLASGWLAGACGAGPAYRRRSCCLYYRVPGGGLCGDCALDRVPGKRSAAG